MSRRCAAAALVCAGLLLGCGDDGDDPSLDAGIDVDASADDGALADADDDSADDDAAIDETDGADDSTDAPTDDGSNEADQIETDAETGGDDADLGPIGHCGPIGTPRVVAIHRLKFAVEAPPGVARGFNIDGHATRFGNAEGCGKPDFVDPQGREGIDNQFARLLPALDSATGEPTDNSLERAIVEGELILLIEIESLTDPTNDDCVSLNIYRATSDIVFGTDGRLLAGQSFDIDRSRPWTRVDEATIEDGVLRAGPFRLELPLTFFSTNLTVVLAQAWIEGELRDDGGLDGILGGAANVEDLLQTARDIDPGFVGIAQGLLGNNADLSPNERGDCQDISIAWEFEARAGHLYPDTERP